MLEPKFYIVGGYMKIERKVFIQEMLSKDSCLRQILNWKGDEELGEKHPLVSEPDEDGMVTINFNFTVHIELGQSATRLLSRLKEKYGDRVGGRICCRWLAGYSMSNFTIDLDCYKLQQVVQS